MTHIKVANRVLALEAKALSVLSDTLGADFDNAVDVILSCKGRVVVSGMGKSGHIGAKIASTLASTGTQSVFVHPAEASHGDLGMVSQDDVVLLLSNSGETTELGDFINYVTRYGIKSISITKIKTSTLGSATDICLELPNVAEACPLGLAPTTSTTATLALGDALAVCLIDAKGFSANDFKQFHPGGKLGQQLLYVRDIMQSGDVLPLVAAGTTIKDSVSVMQEKRLGCVGVVENEVLLGIFTDGDLLRNISNDVLDQKIDALMNSNPITVTSNTLAGELLSIMESKKISAVFVVDNNVVTGIVHFHYLLKAGVA